MAASLERFLHHEVTVLLRETFIRGYPYFQFAAFVLYPLACFYMLALFDEVHTGHVCAVLADEVVVSASFNCFDYSPILLALS